MLLLIRAACQGPVDGCAAGITGSVRLVRRELRAREAPDREGRPSGFGAFGTPGSGLAFGVSAGAPPWSMTAGVVPPPHSLAAQLPHRFLCLPPLPCGGLA